MRVRFQVHGRVQGVGYRAFARDIARSLGLAGWVANAWDGTVIGVAEGGEADLATFRARLQEGPSRASVLRVDWEGLDAGESLPFPFGIRPS